MPTKTEILSDETKTCIICDTVISLDDALNVQKNLWDETHKNYVRIIDYLGGLFTGNGDQFFDDRDARYNESIIGDGVICDKCYKRGKENIN